MTIADIANELTQRARDSFGLQDDQLHAEAWHLASGWIDAVLELMLDDIQTARLVDDGQREP